jgi:hypothetical protein
VPATGEALVVVVPVGCWNQRRGSIDRSRFQRFEHLVHRRLHLLGDLLDGRRSAERMTQHLDGAAEREIQLLAPPRNTERPRVVTEVASQLAQDRGHGECREQDTKRRVEAVGCLDQAELGHLNEIVKGLTTPSEASSTMNGDPAVVGHELVTKEPVPVLAVVLEAGRHLGISRHGSHDALTSRRAHDAFT